MLIIYIGPYVICVVETWLSHDINDTEISIPDFQLFRNDRNRQGGGVLVYVSSMFFVSVLLPPPPALEILTPSVLFNNFKVYVCHPPSSHSSIFDTLFSYLDSINVYTLNNF